MQEKHQKGSNRAKAEQLEPAELVGLVARSVEGTAAKGMPIKGHEDLWVDIQANTFRNWVNEHLKQNERGRVLGPVHDLSDDFRDGTRLCVLVEQLIGKPFARKWTPNPVNQHHYLENVSTALEAVEADGVKLVNIGNVDIVNGNLKLILGLIWSLIVRYQIGKSKFPPRKLMLSWLKAVLPECRVNNFTTDWNSGVYLSALLDYCKPGLFSHWRQLDPSDNVYNCRKAMEIAKREFDIPMVLQPEYLASAYLDELSGMTYLSYFMKDGSPGFDATLRWVNSQLPYSSIKNFTTDWNDGTALCGIVRNLGGPAPPYEKIERSSAYWEHNLQQGIDGGRKLGVEPLLKAKDMADENVEHLGVMGYVAFFQWVRPRPQLSEQAIVQVDSTSARLHQPAHFKLELISKDVITRQIRGEVISPTGRIECRLTWSGLKGKGTFVPAEVGMHKLMVYNDGELLLGCPYYFRVHPPLTKIKSPGMDPCAIGSVVEVLVNSYGTSHEGVSVSAWSPTGRELNCPVRENDGVHVATFEPDETGEWSIAITHKGAHIQGGPFNCFVFDPHGVELSDLEGASPGRPFGFSIDASATGGLGNIVLDIVHDKQSVPHFVQELGRMKYRASFVPREPGKYRIYVYFNGSDVRGSPFLMRVAGSSGHHRSSRNSSINRRSSAKASPSPASSSPRATESPEKSSAISSLERRMNGLNGSTSSLNNTYHHQQQSYGKSSPKINPQPRTNIHNDRMKMTDSPTFAEEKKEKLSSSYFGQTYKSSSASPSPVWGRSSPAGGQGIGESKDLYNNSTNSRQSSFNQPHQQHYTKSSFTSNNSTSYTKSKDLDYGFHSREGSNPPGDKNGIVDTSSNVKVSPSSKNSLRRDSWDAIAKTKSLLSYGSLESLANLTNDATLRDSTNNTGNGNHNVLTNGASKITDSYLTSSCESVPKIISDSNGDFANSRGILKNKVNGTSKLFDSVVSSSSMTSMSSTTMTTTTKLPTITTTATAKKANVPSNSHERLYANESSSALRSNNNGNAGSDSPVSGSALEMLAVHRPTCFTIDPSLDASKIAVIVTGPNGRPVPVQKSSLRGQSYTVMADQVGEHTIQILYNGQHVKGSPFKPQAYDSKAIQVANIPNGVVNEPVEFEIDGTRAGSGNLEILVNGGHVTSFVRTLGSQKFLASFVPHEAVTHLVEMTFNGETVPGSPWKVGIMPSPKMSVVGDSVRLVPAGSPALFELSALGFNSNEIQVQILTPSKRQIGARIEEEPNRKGEFRVTFTPQEVGSHFIEVSIAGQKLPAGPLVAKVYNSGLIQVTEVPSAVVGHPCQFRVDASAAGEGQLEISINEGEVPNHVQVVGGGRCLVSFTPEAAKPHYIDIKFNGEPVPGCPFVCLVSDTSRVSLSLAHLELLPVDEPASFRLGVDGSGSAELAVSVRGPGGSELPVKVTGDVYAGFSAEFTPYEVGAHAITVEYNGHPVNGTPFLAKAFDASRVVIGPIGRASVGRAQHFSVDASQAGEGNLEITISARGQNIPTQVTPQGNARFSVGFVPYEACEHHVNIAFNKRTVPGCPLVARVEPDAHVTVSGQALSSAPLGRQSTLALSNVAGNAEDLEVNVEGPNGQAVAAQVTDNKDMTCTVAFTPRLVGEHRISISHKKLPVMGSPFSCKVYDVAAIKVKDAKRGVIGLPVTFLVETSQAGPGNLEVTVNGGRVPTSAQAQGPHTYAISFTPREPISHTIDLRFNGEDVPGSPFTCQVNDAAKVVVTEALEKVPVNKVASFVVEAETTPSVDVLAPTRESLPVDITPSSKTSGLYTAGFTPKDVGDHSVQVKLNGSHVQGSPFLVKAYNADQVKVTDINSGVVGKPVFFSINASQAGAGNLEIIVSVNGKNVPNFVQSEGNAKFRVNFKPQEAATHSLSVRFNGEPVPGSPFTCQVVGTGQTLLNGHNLKMAPVRQPITFTLDPQVPSNKCDVIVTPPSNIALPITIEPIDQKYKITFTPTEVGRHNVSVLVDSEPIKGSPFACNVYDVTKIHVSGLSEALLGQATTFTVDAAQAGEGTLELVVSTENNTVKAEVVACARGLYDVTFVPQTSSTHYVNISFNDDNVPGSPFKCPVVGSILEGPSVIRVGNTAYLDLDAAGISGPISAEVTGPDGNVIPCNLTKLDSSAHRIEVRAKHVGTYSVVFSQGSKVISSQSLQAFDPSKVMIQEISDVVCHRPGTLTVLVPKEAGPGKLTAYVRSGGADVDSLLREKDEGIYEVIFHPTRAAPHRVHIKYNDVHIQESPIEVAVRGPAGGREVTATGLGLYQSCVGKVTSFSIETMGRPGKEFDVVISGPQGNAVPVRCYQHRDGTLLAEFTTSSIGTYKIDVLHGSKSVLGSPFFCHAFDPTKIKLQELGNPTISVHDHFALKIIKTDAGVAELDVTATSPLGQEVGLESRSLGEDAEMIEFSPAVVGSYTINVSYGGVPVPGSPLCCVAEAAGQARAKGQGLLFGHVGKPAHFLVTGSRPPPAVQVDGPDSVVKPCVEAGPSPGTWSVTYVPSEPGVFDVRVVCAGQQLPGSPWHPNIVDTRNLRVIGGWPALCDDLGRLKLGPGCKISFDTAEAGPGQLTGSIDEQPLSFEPTSNGRLKLIVPQQVAPGEHAIDILFNGMPFPGAPTLAITPETSSSLAQDSSRVVLRGKGLTTAKCGEQVSFTIDGSQAGAGTPQVQIFSPSSEVDVVLQHLGNSVYRASYTPFTSDSLLMTVSWNGRQLKGCPLQISVSNAADSSRVICSGQGLKYGIVGQEIKSFIDTRRAGPGELTAHCVGPHKVAYCELYDHGDATFTLNVKPQEAGRHALTIKYAGDHVPGSPFTLKVSGAPDASKVRVYGPGIEHGVLATFQSRFICDTRGAGAGQLTVRVRGPKGAFRVEMQRETQKDRIILCRYDPTEPGDYRVEVRWAGALVPGSPFPVKIVDTQDELIMLAQGIDTCATNHHTLTSWRGSQAIL